MAVLNANGQVHPEVSICCHHKGAASGSWREKPDGSRVKSKLVDSAGRNLFQKFAVKERAWDLAKLFPNVFKDLSMLACHRHWEKKGYPRGRGQQSTVPEEGKDGMQSTGEGAAPETNASSSRTGGRRKNGCERK